MVLSISTANTPIQSLSFKTLARSVNEKKSLSQNALLVRTGIGKPVGDRDLLLGGGRRIDSRIAGRPKLPIIIVPKADPI